MFVRGTEYDQIVHFIETARLYNYKHIILG